MFFSVKGHLISTTTGLGASLFFRIFFMIFALGTAAFSGMVVYLLENDPIQRSAFDQRLRLKPSLILDDEGVELARFEPDKRTPIFYDQIPEKLVKAFIAAEDHYFFTHAGISLRGILRSALVNFYHGKVVQGASTITQQIARLMYLTHDRTWWRKIQEILLAFKIERQLTKEQIFELYLNHMYFGRGIYGVQAACQRFWHKSVSEVTLDEAALLAAIAKSARFYSPLNDLQGARKRRNIVLSCMKKLGFISDADYQQAVDAKVQVDDSMQGSPIRLYIQEWIRTWAEKKWGKEAVYSGGLKIKTTINTRMQDDAEKAFLAIALDMRKQMGSSLNGGMVTMHVATGKVKCFVGGIDFRTSQFNRAFQASRQMGSSFKPMLYALALRSGYDMDSVFVDEPIEMQTAKDTIWKPKNWNNKFEGAMTLIRALTFSNNMIAIKLLQSIGAQSVITFVQRFGITNKLTPYPSLALGTAHATTEQNAAAFNVFANNGMYVAPFLVEWVKNESGKIIWEHEPVRRRVLDTKTNAKMVKALMCRMNISNYFSKNGLTDVESIGKTGTTNGAATTWFVGSTTEFTTAVYLGRDDNKQMGNCVYASKTVFPIWLNFSKTLKHTKKHFYFDPSLREVPINWYSGEEEDALVEGNFDIVPILK